MESVVDRPVANGIVFCFSLSLSKSASYSSRCVRNLLEMRSLPREILSVDLFSYYFFCVPYELRMALSLLCTLFLLRECGLSLSLLLKLLAVSYVPPNMPEERLSELYATKLFGNSSSFPYTATSILSSFFNFSCRLNGGTTTFLFLV